VRDSRESSPARQDFLHVDLFLQGGKFVKSLSRQMAPVTSLEPRRIGEISRPIAAIVEGAMYRLSRGMCGLFEAAGVELRQRRIFASTSLYRRKARAFTPRAISAAGSRGHEARRINQQQAGGHI